MIAKVSSGPQDAPGPRQIAAEIGRLVGQLVAAALPAPRPGASCDQPNAAPVPGIRARARRRRIDRALRAAGLLPDDLPATG